MITAEQIKKQDDIKNRLLAAGVKQFDLSRQIGCPYGSLNQYLNGIYPMPGHVLNAIEEVLKGVE